MKLPSFHYQSPTSLDDAIRILSAEEGAAKIIAGGQSLMPMMAFRLASPSILVDLASIPDLDRIAIDATGVTFGAMVRWRDIEEDGRLRAACPLVAAAVEHIAHYQIRNRGTIGGSLAHADPSAEIPGIAVTCDAEIEIVGPRGSRLVAASDFIEGPLTTCLSHDEIIRSVRFPPWSVERRWAFEEFAQRRGDFAYAGIALHYAEAACGAISDAHVGVIGATNIPRRLPLVEKALNGKRLDSSVVAAAATIGSAAVQVADDLHASAEYRRALVGTLIERTLATAANRIM
jgi:carbon-monoxide dehydrogenase medium subunit